MAKWKEPAFGAPEPPIEAPKWQAKAAKQAAEITRLQREVTALRDDLADIRAQRNEARDCLRKIQRFSKDGTATVLAAATLAGLGE